MLHFQVYALHREVDVLEFVRLGQVSKIYPVPQLGPSRFSLRVPDHLTPIELELVIQEAFGDLRTMFSQGEVLQGLGTSADIALTIYLLSKLDFFCS